MCEKVEPFLDQLPNELLLEVLSHLDLQSLSNIMQSSRKYFKLITKSNCLNKKFVLKIDRRKISKENCGVETFSESLRDFHSFNVRWLGGAKDIDQDSSVASKNLWTIFQKFGGKVKKLEFGPGTVNLIFLKNILDLCGNVEEICFMNSRFVESQDFARPTTLNNLKTLKIDSYKDESVFIKVFTEIKSLRCFSSNQDSQKCLKILQNQPDLQDLDLADPSGKLFGEDITLMELPFKLKKFQYCSYNQHLNEKNLSKFLKAQDDLTVLKLELNFSEENLLKVILNKKFMRVLHLTYQAMNISHLTYLPNNRSVQHLKLSTNSEESAKLQEKFVGSFSSLESLKLEYNVNFSKDTKISFKSNPNLKRIEVDLEVPRRAANCLENIEIPNLVKLTVNFGKNSPEEWRRFLKTHPSIKYLNLINSNLDDEIVLVVVESLKELKEFKCKTQDYEQLKYQLKLSQERLRSS